MPEPTPPAYQPGGVVTPPAGDPVAATIGRVEAIVDRLYLNMLGEVRQVEAERDRLASRIALATTYTLSALPEDNTAATAFQITVEHRGRDRWAVLRHRYCLSADGEWDFESCPSEREDEWLMTHRFDLDTALRLAEEALPTLTVNGMTAADVLARFAALDTLEADRG